MSLAEEEQPIPTNVSEHIALAEHDMRREVADRILRIFTRANTFVLGALGVGFAADVVLIATGVQTPEQRLVDAAVLRVLIGATAVQVGTIMVSIAAYLFPRRR